MPWRGLICRANAQGASNDRTRKSVAVPDNVCHPYVLSEALLSHITPRPARPVRQCIVPPMIVHLAQRRDAMQPLGKGNSTSFERSGRLCKQRLGGEQSCVHCSSTYRAPDWLREVLQPTTLNLCRDAEILPPFPGLHPPKYGTHVKLRRCCPDVFSVVVDATNTMIVRSGFEGGQGGRVPIIFPRI